LHDAVFITQTLTHTIHARLKGSEMGGTKTWDGMEENPVTSIVYA